MNGVPRNETFEPCDICLLEAIEFDIYDKAKAIFSQTR